MANRVRHRQVSPERIAKVAEAMKARGLSVAIKLGTDGSVLLTESDGAALKSEPEGDAEAIWNRALGIQ
jgi:hypothetical protein